jgi:hypothetical protein
MDHRAGLGVAHLEDDLVRSVIGTVVGSVEQVEREREVPQQRVLQAVQRSGATWTDLVGDAKTGKGREGLGPFETQPHLSLIPHLNVFHPGRVQFTHRGARL